MFDFDTEFETFRREQNAKTEAEAAKQAAIDNERQEFSNKLSKFKSDKNIQARLRINGNDVEFISPAGSSIAVTFLGSGIYNVNYSEPTAIDSPNVPMAGISEKEMMRQVIKWIF